jgi:hypothetical protein
MSEHTETFLPLRHAAVRLGVPAAWLEAECRANRLPHLRAGRRLLVNPQAAERALLERAENWKVVTNVAR